jgi:hypothetical protein
MFPLKIELGSWNNLLKKCALIQKLPRNISGSRQRKTKGGGMGLLRALAGN